ncbi:MAG: vWA domain-containing protein [Candidatus Hodarchaeales archaeon]
MGGQSPSDSPLTQEDDDDSEYLERRSKVRFELSRISPRHAVLRALSRSAARHGDYAVLTQIATKYPILVANEVGHQLMYESQDSEKTPDELGQLFFRIKAYLDPQIRAKLKARASELILRRAKAVYEYGIKTRTVSYNEYRPGARWNFELTFEKMVALGERTPTYRSIVSPQRVQTKRSFVLMVDKSHSVYRFMPQIATAAAVLALSLRRENFAVLAFDSSTHYLKAMNNPIIPEQVVDKLLLLEAGGKTNLKEALETGLLQLRTSPAGNKRVACLLSDLEPTEGGNPLPIASQFEDLRILQAPITETQGMMRPLTGQFAQLKNTQLIPFHQRSDIPTLIQNMIYE